MSNFNVSKLRQQLIDYKVSLMFAEEPVLNKVITFCNMFEAIEQSCSHPEMMMPQLQLHRTVEHFKELYFPSLVTRTIKIRVEVPIIEGMARVEQIKNYTKKKLKIFNDVKEVIISV